MTPCWLAVREDERHKMSFMVYIFGIFWGGEVRYWKGVKKLSEACVQKRWRQSEMEVE